MNGSSRPRDMGPVSLRHAHDRQSMRHVFYLRFVYAAMFIVYFPLGGGVVAGLLTMDQLFALLGLYFAATITLFFLISHSGLTPLRIMLSMGLDLLLLSLAFSHDPLPGTPSIVIAPLILFGNGLRHGMQYYLGGLISLLVLVSIGCLLRGQMSPAGFPLEARATIGFTLITAIYGYFVLLRFRQQRESLETQNHYDEVTGLLSRRAIRKLAQDCVDHCRHLEQCCLVFYLDLDNFKQINDRYGHAQGDAALIAIADSLSLSLPEQALCGRHGGDEFVVIMPNTDSREADALSRAMENAVLNMASRWPGVALGVSIGHACAPQDGLSIEDLISYADLNMYKRKRQPMTVKPAREWPWRRRA